MAIKYLNKMFKFVSIRALSSLQRISTHRNSCEWILYMSVQRLMNVFPYFNIYNLVPSRWDKTAAPRISASVESARHKIWEFRLQTYMYSWGVSPVESNGAFLSRHFGFKTGLNYLRMSFLNILLGWNLERNICLVVAPHLWMLLNEFWIHKSGFLVSSSRHFLTIHYKYFF